MANKKALRFIPEPQKLEVARRRASASEPGCSQLAARDYLDGLEKPKSKKVRKGGQHGRQA